MHTVSAWDRFIGAAALFIGVMLTLIAPFLTVVLLFMAIPFQAIGAALSSRKTRGGIGMHLGIGITIAFAYILFMQISKSYAISGSLSPFMAVWIPNFIFAALGVYLLKMAPK